ncbi:MAG: formylmethanofuran dehydrogenase subunit B [Planctomycetota bacterium]
MAKKVANHGVGQTASPAPLPREPALHVIDNVACTMCGCVCDDLRITVEGERIVKAEGACVLAEPWFLGQDRVSPAKATVRGAEVPFDSAVREAAKILAQAKSPLIYGLSRSSTEGQRAATSLADAIRATIDTTASLCHAPSIVALQQVGESTCSLGETKNRADLIIYWGSNPVESHPRHLERYSADSVGQWRQGRKDRFLVVVDVHPTASSACADLFMPIEPGRDFEALWTLRALVRGIPPGNGQVTGAPLPLLADLAERMKTCQSGIVFFGLGLTRGATGHRHVQALLELVTDLNQFTCFYARRMRVPGDVSGADSVLCWQTGYPFSVNLAPGFPRYNPGEFSANHMLERDEVDACLFIGSEGVQAFSPRAVERISRIPTIALDYPTVPSYIQPTVRFTTAVYGIHREGTAYRMDEVPIPLRAVLKSDYPSDADVLSKIENAITSSNMISRALDDRRNTASSPHP